MKKLVSVGIFLSVLLFIQGINSAFGCIEGERQALLKLKQSFKDPSNRLVSWNGEDCCLWSGVSCDRSNRHVVKLDLRVPSYFTYFGRFYVEYNTSEQLSSLQVDSCLAELKHLEYLDLSGNDFNRSRIPEFFGSFKHLTYLYLTYAGFGGKIPHQLGNLTSLKVLDLSYNYYAGALYADNFQWASSLLSLQHLHMSFVGLSKALDLMPVLNKLPSLVQLQLNGCKIRNIHFSRGSVNSTFLASIQFLGLRRNELSGEIPKAFHNMTALRQLDLSDQWDLYADNLQWVSSLSSLQQLDMSGVNLSMAHDLMQVLNTLPSLLNLRLDYCGIQSIDFSHATVNSTFFASVQYLYLSSNMLSGPVPNALKNMTELRELDLSYNNFNSSIPLCLFNSKSLVRLDIWSNQFDNIEGGLFSLLNNACSLKFLSLSGNPFRSEVLGSNKNSSSSCLSYSLEFLYLSNTAVSGNIPEWLGKLQSLKYLNLRRNSLLSGPIPSSITELTLLWSLDLSKNQLDGSIPQSLGRLSALEYLDLSNNQLSGAIPESLGRLSALESLYLSNNQLSGAIPESLGRLSVLEYLDLSNNQLSGAIPESLGRLSALEDLQLSYNQLSGIIPRSLIERLTILRFIDLSHNQFNGSIPQSFGRLSTLEYLKLSHNQFSGSFLDSIRQLGSLRSLDVSSNPLEGVISELHFANLSMLTELSISSTNLTWKVESNWIPPFSLFFLNMSSCRIGSQFPHWIQTQKDIGVIDLSNASISGSLPQWFHGTNLIFLDLSGNQISGKPLAMILETALKLETLLLGNNLITGSMPNSLCKLESLIVLDVSRNKLSDEIPHCRWDMQRLLVINLSFNRFSGKIPNSFGHLPYLKRFHVNKNNLDGEVPLTLSNCTNLEILDLGENGFSGSVPLWIGERLLSLRILRLRKNKLKGRIPPQLCQLSELQILDLAENNLIGEIPRCFGNLSGMTTGKPVAKDDDDVAKEDDDVELPDVAEPHDDVEISESMKGLYLKFTKLQLQLLDLIDISYNQLTGVIPEELCLLSGLRGLNLSHNRLSGNIPTKIGDLKLLETLDLSNNKLFGAIPQSMSALPFISHLNLSNNNLSGKIPKGNQLQTLDDPSIYAGNTQLCGDPLQKNCLGDDDSVQQPGRSDHEDREYEDDKKEKIWFWFVVTAGYATGLWAVIGTLVFKRNWRIAYFRFFDNIKEWMLAMVEVKVERMKKMIKKSKAEE